MSRPLTVAVDARPAQSPASGYGRVVRELLAAFARRDDEHRYVAFARGPWPGDGAPDPARVRWRVGTAPDVAWHAWMAWTGAREAAVLLAPASYLVPLLAPPGSRCVTIVHDLTATTHRGLRPARKSLITEAVTRRAALRRSDAVVAVSEHVAGEVRRTYPWVASRLTVAPLGVAPVLGLAAAARVPAVVPEPRFVLAIGVDNPRKNIERLARAYARVPEAVREGCPLVVAGPDEHCAPAVVAALDALGPAARRLGAIDDATLAALYRGCTLFCYPSLAEGFGLPVAEAMAAGAAVLTSNRTSLPEVGGDAVAYVDPEDERALAAALERLLGDDAECARLGAAAKVRAERFDWDATAAAVVEVLEQVAD